MDKVTVYTKFDIVQFDQGRIPAIGVVMSSSSGWITLRLSENWANSVDTLRAGALVRIPLSEIVLIVDSR